MHKDKSAWVIILALLCKLSFFFLTLSTSPPFYCSDYCPCGGAHLPDVFTLGLCIIFLLSLWHPCSSFLKTEHCSWFLTQSHFSFLCYSTPMPVQLCGFWWEEIGEFLLVPNSTELHGKSWTKCCRMLNLSNSLENCLAVTEFHSAGESKIDFLFWKSTDI